MRMQVILDSSFARPGSAPIWGGKKGELRDWTSAGVEFSYDSIRAFNDRMTIRENRRLRKVYGNWDGSVNGTNLEQIGET